jgi:hypothetical protein
MSASNRWTGAGLGRAPEMKRGIRWLQVNKGMRQLELHIAAWVRQNSGFISHQENS